MSGFEAADSDKVVRNILDLLSEIELGNFSKKIGDAEDYGIFAPVIAKLNSFVHSQEMNGIFRGIIMSTQDSILMMDSDGRITYWNPAAEKLFGYTKAEAVGNNLHTLLVPAKYHASFEGAFPNFLLTGQGGLIGKTIEVAALHKKGHEIQVELSLSAVRMNDSWHSVGIIRDLTERKAQKVMIESQQSNLMSTQEQLFQTLKLATLGEMAAGMAHEMNQPLSGIMLAAQMIKKLKEKNLLTDEELKENLGKIQQSVERCTKVIEHVRTFSRQEKPKFSDVAVNETRESALILLGEQLRLRGIEVVRTLDVALPKIQGDLHQLEQIWINLLTNSRDALADRGGQGKQITIKTKVNFGNILVEIADNGVGMSPEVLEKVFEPFFTTKPPGKGTGLGMSIIHGIVEAHRAIIEVKSEPQKGTTVTVGFPCGEEGG
ncbi:ATP-binding protein [Bdellovibrionota bacterium FG-2]